LIKHGWTAGLIKRFLQAETGLWHEIAATSEVCHGVEVKYLTRRSVQRLAEHEADQRLLVFDADMVKAAEDQPDVCRRLVLYRLK
jgi:hypothetical protein